MGYMGFGMRKESYKRKPRPAFEIRNAHGRLTDSDKVTHSKSGNPYFKPSYKNPRFWIFMIVSVGAILWLLTSNRLNSSLFSFLVSDDTQKIKEFYEERKTDIDSIFQYVNKKEGKLAGIEIDKEGIVLKLRSENYEQVRGDQLPMLRHRNSTDFHSKEEPEIINGALKVDTYGYHRLFTDFWSYDLKVARLQDINTTIIAHLETSYSELHEILKVVGKEHFKVRSSGNEVSLHFRFRSRDYKIIMNDQNHGMDHASHTPLDSGVCFKIKSRFSDLAE